MIVPGGGLSLDGTRDGSPPAPTSSCMSTCWRACFGARCWRCSLAHAHDAGQLEVLQHPRRTSADKRTFRSGFIAPWLRRIRVGGPLSRRRSQGPSRCCAISPVTLISLYSPFRTSAASLQPTTPALRSAGSDYRITTARAAGRRCGFTLHEFIRTLPAARVACQGLPPHPPLRALLRPANRADSIATARALLNVSPNPPPRRKSSRMSRRIPRVCCRAHARAVALA